MTSLLTEQHAGWTLDNSYARLPDFLYTRQSPVPVRSPELVICNDPLAGQLGLQADVLRSRDGVEVLAGNRLPEGAEPLAQAYAGHQFGYFTMLGDGRAILLGEQITPDGRRYDLQLKGSGITPYSRSGDGRAALGPMLREYIISEAMHALGIPTTRSLAVTLTGEPVYRETTLQGAVLTRVAASHLRVGTFQYVAARRNVEELRLLADYTIDRHDPEVRSAEHPYLALLKRVVDRQAALIAKWMLVGFIHGVMNTDNMALSGETIDYGPCAFMDRYDPRTVFSSIDAQGRYAYGHQPPIAAWNLARFAETLLPLIHADEEEAIKLAEATVSTFGERYKDYWLSGMRAKLGLFNEEEEDEQLSEQLLQLMVQYRADYTNTFRALTMNKPLEGVEALLASEGFASWYKRWQARLDRQEQPASAVRERMQSSNPAVIPRNHRVEQALDAAVNEGDYSVMEQLLKVLSKPFDDTADHEPFCQLPAPTGRPYRTYCGT